ncbi:MAG: nucleotidyltransferase domain-containing protein [Nitrososphaerales archaeon]
MNRTLPNWLAKKYFHIVSTFGYLPFSMKEVKNLSEKYSVSVLLAKMCSYGWLHRLDRGIYMAIPPIIALMKASGNNWGDKILQRDRLPILDLIVARLIEELGPKLRSIVLFGSLARGKAKPESDIDLLVVADSLPERYSERVKIISKVKNFWQLDHLILKLWKEKGIYTNLDILLITKEEAGMIHPFYLDMVDEGILILDKDEIMAKKIKEVKDRLREIGAIKIVEPEGSWYWILPKETKG